MTMNSLIHWFAMYENLLAVVVTAGVVLLLVCCLECSTSPCREKDDLFKRHTAGIGFHRRDYNTSI
jgi:hypothetical protein